MKKLITVCLASLLVVALAVPALADLEAGLLAYKNMQYDRALQELHPLAQKGNAKAQLYMGLLCSETPGLPQDFKQAAQWFQKAAEQGEAEAQNQLGSLYVLGLGVPESFIKGAMWFNLAAGKGNIHAKERLKALYEAMTAQQIAEAQRLAREWKPKKPGMAK